MRIRIEAEADGLRDPVGRLEPFAPVDRAAALLLLHLRLSSMTKELIVVTLCLLLIAVDAGVIVSHVIIPTHYVHSGDYHQWIALHHIASPGTLNFVQDQYPAVIPRHAVNGQVSRSDDDTVEGRRSDDQDVSFGEATIPNYRMFQFVLKLVKSMRKHFLPAYATNAQDVSNIDVQYGNDKRRSMIDR